MRSLSNHFRKFNKNLAKLLDNFLENNFLVGIFFGALVLISKLPFVNLPFWWDETNHLEGALKIYQNNFNPFIEWWSYKPPLIFELVALGYNFFGFDKAIPRLIIIFFAFLALYFTFLIGKKLYGKKVGFLASFLLFLSPLFFAQSGLFHTDLPLTALTLVVFYCFLSEKRIGYFVAASLMVLTKETSILVLFAILAYEFLINLKGIFSCRFISTFIFLASPLLFFLSWMLLNQLNLGWYLWPDNLEWFSLASFLDLGKLLTILNFVFWRDFRFLLTILLLVGLLLSLVSKNFRKWFIKKELGLFFFFIVISLVFFWWGPFLPRYFLFIQPLFFIVSLASIVFLIKNRFFLLIFLIIVASLFISQWTTGQVVWGGETNLNYVRLVKVHQQMAQYLEQNWSDYEVLTVWPMKQELSAPEMGYVDEPIEADYLKDKAVEEDRKVLILTNKIFQGEELSRKLRLLSKTEDLKLIKEFNVEGESLLLYLTENIERIILRL